MTDSYASAQTTTAAAISGSVIDVTRGAVPGAKVVLPAETSGAQQTVFTDGAGHFTLQPSAADDYTVLVTLPKRCPTFHDDFRAVPKQRPAVVLCAVSQE